MANDPVLTQPVERPVICKPYYEPTHYWECDRNTGRAVKRCGRRTGKSDLGKSLQKRAVSGDRVIFLDFPFRLAIFVK